MSDEGVYLLLVEDDASYANVLKKLMAHMPGLDLHWRHCERLDAAEKLLEVENFHLVLLDLQLPDSRGFDTFARLARRFPHVGILVLTGLKDEDLAIRAAEAGAFDYLVKGRVSRESLRKALQYGYLRQRANEQHRQSEALYRELFEANPLPMWIEEVETRQILAVNDAAVRHYGYPRARFLELSGDSLIADKANASEVEAHLSGPRSCRHLLGDGSVIHVEISSNPTRFRNCNAEVIAIQDVSARVEQEARLSRQAALLQDTLRLGNMGSWHYDPTQKRLSWSEETGALFGRKDANRESSLEAFLEMVHPEDVTTVETILKQTLPPGKWTAGDFRVVRRNGSVRWMHVRARAEPVTFGIEPPRTGVIADVTKDREARLELLRSTRMLRMAGEKARLGWWHVNLAEQRVIWSEETALIHKEQPGFSPSIADGISYYVPEHREIIRQAFQRCLDEGEPFDLELQILNSAKERVWVRSIGEVFYNTEGEAIGVQGAFQDISEQKRAELRQEGERQILAKIAARADLPVVLRLVEETFQKVTRAAEARVILPQDKPFAALAESLLPIPPTKGDSSGIARFWENLSTCPLCTTLPSGKAEGMASCWTLLLHNANGHPAAIVALFYREATPPSPDEEGVARQLSPLITLAIDESLHEKELEASNRRFQQILNEVPNVAVQGYAVDGAVTYWNAASERLYGYTREEAMGKSLLDLIIPDDLRPAIAASLETLKNGGKPPPAGELLLKDKANSPVFVYSSHVGLRRADGSAEMFCIDIDLRERKAAEQRLLEQAALLDKATDAIVVRDLDNRVLFWNQSAQRLYGWSAEEIRGEPIHQKIYADEATFREATATVVAEGEWKGESEHFDRSGKLIRVEDRWTLVRNETGEPVSILSITTDVTERRKLEQQFLRAQRMESLGTLAGGIAHDLNNLLSPIMMSMDLLNMRIEDPTSLELIENVRLNARRGAEMVKQVLSFARGMEGTRMKIQIRHILREVSNICTDTFPPNIEIRTSLPSDLHTIEGDPTQIHQVLLNLCVNARDAMPRGGTIHLKADNVDIDEQFAAMNIEAVPGPYARIEVTDTGSGIAPAIMNKIFDPFFTTKELGKGTGLGLATVLTILKGHGGFIQVESPPGKGASFRLFLPASSGSVGREHIESPGLPRGDGEWVLVVDDEASVRQITKQTLEAFGYRVLLASDGAEGVSIFASRKGDIAVVLADLTMPVMDGLSMIRVLRRLKADVPIIVASGMSEEERKAEAMNAGIGHFLPKPYTAGSLLRMIRHVLMDRSSPGNPK